MQQVPSLSIWCLASYFGITNLKNMLNAHFMCFGNKFIEVYCNYRVYKITVKSPDMRLLLHQKFALVRKTINVLSLSY